MRVKKQLASRRVAEVQVNNSYSFDHAGSGKAANHLVHTVSWFDCAKWCNARSEMEERTPCCNLGDWSCDFSANGYRLPTEAEWEKAARGGLNGKQYGWGDLIDHSKANYDIDPVYAVGGYPYSSPVASFAPKGKRGRTGCGEVGRDRRARRTSAGHSAPCRSAVRTTRRSVPARCGAERFSLLPPRIACARRDCFERSRSLSAVCRGIPRWPGG